VTTPPGPLDGAPHHLQRGEHGRQINIEGGSYYEGPSGASQPYARPGWPLALGARPPLRADSYLDRPHLRQAVQFRPGRTVVVAGTGGSEAGAPVAGATRVVCGDGGIGKTQLAAAAYASARGAGTDLVMWVTATSRDAILTAYAQAAAVVSPAHAAGTDAEQDAAGFLAWLEATSRSWLLVLDDLTDPADLNRLWPTGPTGQTIITTRRRDASLRGHGRTLIEVDVFTPTEARAYLTGKLTTIPGLPDDVLDQADSLATDLGHLPVALAQAVAVMIDQAWSCAEYRARLADRATTMNDLFTGSGDEYQHVLASAWSLALTHADAQPPYGLVTPLARLIAVLDPNGIPETVLTASPITTYLTGVLGDGAADGPLVDAGQVRAGLRTAHRFSLITHDPTAGPRAVRMHAIAQRAILDPHTPTSTGTDQTDRVDRLIRAAAGALHTVWPEIENDPALSSALRANTTTLVGHDTRHVLWARDGGGAHPLLFRLVESLGGTGAVADAVHAARTLHQQAHDRLGPDHPDTLTTRNELARWRGEAGDPAGAAAACEGLLVDRVRVLGPDYPGTLITRGNLAHWRGVAGDPAGAAAAFEGLLADQLRVLGPDHLDTLITRHDLAHWRGEAGDPVEAVTAFEGLLADRVRVLGPDHLDTLITRSNLAYWRGEAGDQAGAAAAFEGLLADRVRVLGPDHPDTLITRNNLAYWRGEAGDPSGAATAFKELLADYLRVLGPDHPDTLITRGNLARCLGKAGDPVEAVTAFEGLLVDRVRVLGPDHPGTLITRHDLAYWRGEAGDQAGAAAAFEGLLADQLRVLGPDHLDTLTTRHSLARWRGEAGDPAEADHGT
jgi:hypothetical protein